MKQLSRGHAKPTKQSPSRQLRSFDVPWHLDVHQKQDNSGQNIREKMLLNVSRYVISVSLVLQS